MNLNDWAREREQHSTEMMEYAKSHPGKLIKIDKRTRVMFISPNLFVFLDVSVYSDSECNFKGWAILCDDIVKKGKYPTLKEAVEAAKNLSQKES